MKILFLLTTLMLATFSASAAEGGFLFVTFRGEQNPMTEQVYFALSKDGRNWQALNDGQPVLISQLGEKGVRDPYLLRSDDGKKFYLIATDLSIALNNNWGRAVREGSKSIVVWESTDLVNWSQPALVKVAPDDAGCTWAPEAIYDVASQRYLVYWASTTRRDNFEKHRIWGAWTTDFKKFSEPFIYIEKPTTVIDTDIVRGEDGKYYRFTKDEKFKAITMEVSDSVTGTWTDVPGFSLANLVGYEGPQCYLVEPASPGKPATWCLILDYYSRGRGYQPFITNDISKGQFKPAEGFRFPFVFRHGSVLPISQDEYLRLERQWAPHPAQALKSSSDRVKQGNIAIDVKQRTVQLPVKPGTNLKRLDPRFTLPIGATIKPTGPQDFSRGPVHYTVQSQGHENILLHVSAIVHRNPVIEGFYADPDILWSEKTKRFYIYPTSDGFPSWSGTYFKAFSSANLVDWRDEGVILDLPKDVSWAKRSAWAPCIIEKKTPAGYRYYYYFTAAQKIGVAIADHPTGPFKDSGKPLIDFRPPGVNGGQEIDPEVFADPKTGKNYLYWGNGYMAVAELNDDMISLRPDTIKVMTPDRTFREGATVFYRKGLYYFLWSEDDTRSPDYRVRYAAAPSPVGPLTIPKDNLVIVKDPAMGIYGTGHNSVIQIPGRDEWYIVYHRFNYPKGITMGQEAGFHREVCIDRLTFDDAGNVLPTRPTHEGVAPRGFGPIAVWW